ncbi:MAG: hypothetical protein AAFY15_10395, partial [Cyanobacteria bacterium J06648_11]
MYDAHARYLGCLRSAAIETEAIHLMKVSLLWLKELAVSDILKILGSVGIAGAVISFLATQDIRHDRDVFAAWKIIIDAEGHAGNGGRKEAIEFLHSRPLRFPWFCREGKKYPRCIYRQERQLLGNLN